MTFDPLIKLLVFPKRFGRFSSLKYFASLQENTFKKLFNNI